MVEFFWLWGHQVQRLQFLNFWIPKLMVKAMTVRIGCIVFGEILTAVSVVVKLSFNAKMVLANF